jgi:DNA-binding Xre family transcriptional regulator
MHYTPFMAKKKSKRTKLSEQIRHAIKTCGITRYRISKETGISEATLTRFMGRRRGLPMKTLDVLADHLDLDITMGGSPIGKKGK